MTTETASQPQEFSSSFLDFTVLRKPDCVVEFDVFAKKLLIDLCKKKATHSISKGITIPGFRKGKAPESVILKNFASQIEKELQNDLANEALKRCTSIAGIPFLEEEPKVSFTKPVFSHEGAKLSLSFETFPSIPSVNPALCKITEEATAPVTEEQVAETLRQALFFYAKWEVVSDRAVQEGDYIILDADIIETTPSTPLFKDTRFEVTDKSMAKWMKDAVLGKNINEIVEAISVPDEGMSKEEQMIFQPKKVSLTVKKIEIPTLPAIDQDLLTKFGVNSEEDLKKQIEISLNEENARRSKEKLREQAANFLINEHPFDLPKTLITKEINFRTKQLGQDKEFIQYWESLQEEEKQKILRLITVQSEKSVRMFFLSKKLIEDFKIQIPSRELTEASSRGTPGLNPTAQREEAISMLVLEKAQDYILANATKVLAG